MSLKISNQTLSAALIAVAATLLTPARSSEPKASQHRDEIAQTTIEELKNLREKIRGFAPHCNDDSLTLHECPFGDSLEYMGMLCLSGEARYCDQVKAAQDPTGRWWRSPGLVGHEEGVNGSGWATFSRDMARGAWAYLVATKDKEAAIKWFNYIESNNYKLCPKSKEGWDACTTRVGFWNMAREIAEYLDIPKTKKMKGVKFLIPAIYDPIEARVQPIGYQSILTAEGIFIFDEMEKRGSKVRNRGARDKMAQILFQRDPENPFYRFLALGPDQKGAELLLKYCPKELPKNVPVDQYGPIYAVDFGDRMSKGNWKNGAGHYCHFVINAFLNSISN